MDKIGAVVIGRNEGERLKICLRSARKQLNRIIYVDSDSSDGSAEFAESMGVDVIRLDMSIPFSAGRARNEGLYFLSDKYPDLQYVQFIDGDCELNEGWISTAMQFLDENPSFVIARGYLNEMFPEKSVYNMLCDMEWHQKAGEKHSSGGIFMARIPVLLSVNGFNISMIAGEEPELCYRLTGEGWRIYMLDISMAFHDANIIKFSQWWKRSVRSGFAYALGYFMHKADGRGYHKKQTVRIWVWAFFLPIFILLLYLFISSWSLMLLLIYPVQLYRGYRTVYDSKKGRINSIKYSLFNVIGKWPQLIGQIVYLRKKMFNEKSEIIEYK